MDSDRTMKDGQRTGGIPVSNVHSNPFGSNVSGDKAYRRAERIAAALYILTKYMSETEPLRIHAREVAHLLLKDILQLRIGFRVGADAAETSRMHARVREAISLVQLLSVGGYVSKENADMVTRALEELSQFVDAAGATHLAERTVFTKEDLLIDQTIRQPLLRTAGMSIRPGSKTVPGGQSSERNDKRQNSEKDNLSSRRATILDVLKDGKEMAIKDIASFVVGCSEKTVQRELAALVSDGILKKEGEKRWSRYSTI